MADWRSIPCKDVQWDAVPGNPRRVCYNLYRQCREPAHGMGKWHDKSLGDIADMGERQWRREVENCGEVTMEAIRRTIDYAAAGGAVTRNRDAYQPRPWTGPMPAHKTTEETV
jgi:hypothetical protein